MYETSLNKSNLDESKLLDELTFDSKESFNDHITKIIDFSIKVGYPYCDFRFFFY